MSSFWEGGIVSRVSLRDWPRPPQFWDYKLVPLCPITTSSSNLHAVVKPCGTVDALWELGPQDTQPTQVQPFLNV